MIYRSDQGDDTGTDFYKSFSSMKREKMPVSDGWSVGILFFREAYIRPGAQEVFVTEPGSSSLVFALSGTVECHTSGKKYKVAPGEYLVIGSEGNYDYKLSNTSSEWVSYLCIGICTEGVETTQSEFSVDGKNLLFSLELEILTQGLFKAFIGVFDAGAEEIVLSMEESNLFIYVIAGSFEVQNRLLERGDLLSIQPLENIGLKALAPDSILMIIEELD